jgi:hypothetical protein
MARTTKTAPVVAAFVARQSHKVVANLESAGGKLAFHGNIIAEWRGDRLFVRVNGFGPPSLPYEIEKRYKTTANGREMLEGNYGRSPTTLAWLSLIPGVNLSRMKNKLMLGGKEWDGLWLDVTDRVMGKLSDVA